MAAKRSRKFKLLSLWFLLTLWFTETHSETCQKLDNCSCRKSNGKVINLKDVDSTSGPKFKDIPEVDHPIYNFAWNPCNKFDLGNGCSQVLMCQTDTSASPVKNYPAAKSVSNFEVGTDGTVTINYTPWIDSIGYKRTVHIILKCDKNVFPGKIDDVTESFVSKDSTYTTTFTSRCACDDGCPEGGGGSGGESAGGLSVGSILLIVFIPLFFVYLIGGILFNKYQKGVESMPEMIPNHSFWADLPFLAKDGCVFTFKGIGSCCSSLYGRLKGESYEKI